VSAFLFLIAVPSIGLCTDVQAFCQLQEEQLCAGLRLEMDPRDRDGLKRDTWYFLGYQVATIGILYVMPWLERRTEGRVQPGDLVGQCYASNLGRG
jgi:hypothetical protein